MEQRPFGKSGFTVSVVGFGAGLIGDSSISENESNHFLNTLVDNGINLIDTARSYGMSEKRIGRYLKTRRKEIVLSTKIGYGIEGYQDWTPPIIEAGVDRALRLLQTDWIDIVHLHSCPLDALIQGGIVDALERAVKTGKARVAAYSGDNEPFEWALNSGRFGGLQTSINICDQRAIPSLNKAQEQGIGIVAKRSLANTPWLDLPHTTGDSASVEYRNRWKKMAFGFSPAEATETALRFVAFLPGVCSCLVGSRNLLHILENIRLIERGPLNEEVKSKIRFEFQAHDQNWMGQI